MWKTKISYLFFTCVEYWILVIIVVSHGSLVSNILVYISFEIFVEQLCASLSKYNNEWSTVEIWASHPPVSYGGEQLLLVWVYMYNVLDSMGWHLFKTAVLRAPLHWGSPQLTPKLSALLLRAQTLLSRYMRRVPSLQFIV